MVSRSDYIQYHSSVSSLMCDEWFNKLKDYLCITMQCIMGDGQLMLNVITMRWYYSWGRERIQRCTKPKTLTSGEWIDQNKLISGTLILFRSKVAFVYCFRFFALSVSTNTYLDHLFHSVVDTEKDEDTFTGHDYIVHHSHISDQLHSSKRWCRNSSTCCRKLDQESKTWKA